MRVKLKMRRTLLLTVSFRRMMSDMQTYVRKRYDMRTYIKLIYLNKFWGKLQKTPRISTIFEIPLLNLKNS